LFCFTTMKAPCVLVLVLVLIGCASDRPRAATLAPEQATEPARRLANEKAQALYNCRLFSNGSSAQLVEGCWVWQDRRRQGQLGLEVTVNFARDGANPSVKVVLLNSRPSAPFHSR
jgi:hypothetical protein